MTKTKLQLLIGFACATVALATASLQAQTLPVTTGLQLWLRADAGITTNASGVVTNWADQSGVGNNATSPDPTKAPTLQLNAFPNGLPALRFSGGTKYLDVASTPSLSSLGENVTMLVVVEYDNFTGFQASIAKTANGIAEPFDTWTSAGTDNGATRFYKNAGTATTYNFVTCNLSPPPVAGIYNAFAFTLTNNVFSAYIDNRPYGAGTMPGTPLDSGNPLRIGSRDNTGTQLIGGMAEVLIYQPALSAGDVLNVITNYLAPKYNLPIDAQPTVSITSPADGATAAAPGSVHVNITAADSDGTVARVNVYANGALLGGSTASPYQLDLACTHPGTVVLTAVATDNLGLATTSAPVTVNFTGYAPATPPVSSALNVWLKADAGVTTDGSGDVTSWADQSLSGNDATQLDPGMAPTLVPNVVNGKPVLRFSGDSVNARFLEVPNATTGFLTNGFSTFALARFNGFPTTTPLQVIWTKNATGWPAPVDWYFNGGISRCYLGPGTSSGTGPVISGSIPSARFVVVGLTVSTNELTNTVTHYLSFAANGTGTIITNLGDGGQTLRIGRRDDNLTQLNGDVAEILIYNQVLSSTDASNAVAYLWGKYAITDPVLSNPPPVVTITSPINNSTVVAPATVTFAASASSADGAITKMSMIANGTTWATFTSSPCQLPLSLLSTGVVTFTVIAQDSWGTQSTSAPVVVTVTGSGGSGLLPTSGLKLHLTADAGVTVNGTNGVTSWADQSLSGNDATTLSSSFPTLVSGALNGRPVIHFTNSTVAAGLPQQYMEVPTANLGFLAGNSSTFILAQFGGSSFRTVLSKTANNNKAAPFDWYVAATGIITVNRGNGSTVGGANGTTAIPNATFTPIGCAVSGQVVTHYLGYNANGSGTITAAVGDAGDPMRIGRRYDNGTFGNEDIAEVVMYDHAVSTTERQQILNYLYAHWGYAVIVSGNVPPTVTLTSPTNGTSVSAPGLLSLVANATDPDSAIAKVDFLVNGVLAASRTTAPYQIPLQVLTPGTLTIQARGVDVYGATSNSAPVTVTVTGSGPAAPPTSGLALWLKADAGVTTNSDGSVALWQDQSGNNNNAVQTSFTPMLVTNETTHQAALAFDGTLQYLDIASLVGVDLTGNFTMLYAANFLDFAANRAVLSKCVGPYPRPIDYDVSASTGIAQLFRGDATPRSQAVLSSSPLLAGQYVEAGATVNGNTVTHYLNNLPNGSGLFGYQGDDAGGPLRIGSRDDYLTQFAGNLGEILLYNSALAGSDLQTANSYLGGKYGIPMAKLYTGAPALTVTKTGANTVQLSWLPGYADFILDSRTNAASGTWTPMATNPPNNQVTVTTTNVTRFFRLRSK